MIAEVTDEQDLPSARTAVRGVKRGRLTVSRLHRSGPSPHRVLLVGDQQQLAQDGLEAVDALGERIADRIWLRTRRGLDLDMLWELRPVLRAIADGFSAWRLWRYDAVIVIATTQPTRRQARGRQQRLAELLRRVIGEIGTASHVLVVSLGRSEATADLDSLEADDHDEHPDAARRVAAVTVPTDARMAADAVAAHLERVLDDADAGARHGSMDAAHRRRQQPDAEDERQRAVDALALRERRIGRRLQHLVSMAQGAFETATAEITIIDHDKQWTLVGAGASRAETARQDSLCSRSIRQAEPTLIGDTWSVPALRGNPLITGPRPIRFYAAHPIESIDGYRIGVLCVWDDIPHDVEDFDLSAFRDLALLAEAEILSDEEI